MEYIVHRNRRMTKDPKNTQVESNQIGKIGVMTLWKCVCKQVEST